MINPLKFLFGRGPLVKAEGVSDQIQDKRAERYIGIGWMIFCSLVGIAIVILASRGCGCSHSP
jgi:hypothetical protein